VDLAVSVSVSVSVGAETKSRSRPRVSEKVSPLKYGSKMSIFLKKGEFEKFEFPIFLVPAFLNSFINGVLFEIVTKPPYKNQNIGHFKVKAQNIGLETGPRLSV